MTAEPWSPQPPTQASAHGRPAARRAAKVLRYAVQSMRLRLGRTLITAACVAGAIAFLSYNVFALRSLSSPEEPETDARALAGAGGDFFEGLDRFTVDRSAEQKRLFVVVLSLLVASVGITNSMLIALKERYREIATLKCLGAPHVFIRGLFLAEALLLGLAGSSAGWLLGLVLHLGGQEAVAPAAWLALAGLACFGVGVLMTLAASVWPIRLALAMMPVEALRVEE